MKVAFIIPGNNHTGWFLENWTDLIQSLSEYDIEWKLFRGYKPNVFQIRQDLLDHAISFNEQIETFEFIYSLTEEQQQEDLLNDKQTPAETPTPTSS